MRYETLAKITAMELTQSPRLAGDTSLKAIFVVSPCSCTQKPFIISKFLWMLWNPGCLTAVRKQAFTTGSLSSQENTCCES